MGTVCITGIAMSITRPTSTGKSKHLSAHVRAPTAPNAQHNYSHFLENSNLVHSMFSFSHASTNLVHCIHTECVSVRVSMCIFVCVFVSCCLLPVCLMGWLTGLCRLGYTVRNGTARRAACYLLCWLSSNLRSLHTCSSF